MHIFEKFPFPSKNLIFVVLVRMVTKHVLSLVFFPPKKLYPQLMFVTISYNEMLKVHHTHKLIFN